VKSNELEVGDWIKIQWVFCELYVIENNEDYITFASPLWEISMSLTLKHWYLRKDDSFTLISKSKPNPFYNKLTKLSGFIHPVTKDL